MTHRAVVTGIGLLTPIGNDPDTFFDNALRGYCGIDRVQKFDTSGLAVHIGGEIKIDEQSVLSEELRNETPVVAQWAVIAARNAVKDAHLNIGECDPYSIDVVLGMSISSIECLWKPDVDDGQVWPAPSGVNPVFMNPAAAAVQISRDLELNGEAINVSSACSSTTSAVGYALRLIRSGVSNCILTGGADEGVSKLFLGAYGKALSQRSNDPGRACRPFDRSRDGTVFSDAACIFVLEEYQHARARGAQIYCEITGFGATSEANSPFQLTKSEEASSICVQRAIKDAAIENSQIDYHSALGISHPFLDIRETRMLKRVFGEHAKRLAISSIKSMIGHPLGTSGMIQAAACAMAIKRKAVPPTINYDEPDPECDLDYVPNQARQLNVRNALMYTLGNGGANAALVLSAC